jgi:hypothetical protein
MDTLAATRTMALVTRRVVLPAAVTSMFWSSLGTGSFLTPGGIKKDAVFLQ